jgi:phosphate transport system permease protein
LIEAGPLVGVARPRKPIEGYQVFTTLIALTAPVVLVVIVVVLALQAWPAIGHFGPDFLVTRTWNPVTLEFGALPFIFGTVVTSFLALAMALPVGVGIAIFLAEPGAAGIRGVIGAGVELLAAIPSVVYGLWGLYVLAPWLLLHVSEPLSERFGYIPIFAGPARQQSLLAASLILAVMILPTLSAISRDVIKAVPGGLRETSHSLGATWWETIWRVILPAARAGIFGATVLALGRALGETIAVTMMIGNRPDIQASLFGSGDTLASVIANQFTEATDKLHSAALLELGLILLVITLVVNVAGLLLVRSLTRRTVL